MYKDNLAGQEWDPAAQYEETVPAGRKWITIRTGSQNGGGHSYAGATGPALLLDKDRTIKPADVFSLSFTPINSGNFGFFYSYVMIMISCISDMIHLPSGTGRTAQAHTEV